MLNPFPHRKTERFDGAVMVSATGYACIGCMAAESPFIEFDADGKTIVWHSENVARMAQEHGFPSLYEMRGRWVRVVANIRPCKGFNNRFQVQRMHVLEDR